ncbi:MAG TPA: D-alanine--D-alanine ligase [Chromatiales bacterium]|nr:D-alanine--D-alanine ligase [Thiotrichales bacterium]HIP69448.1 D-alanine--D-alanine ligase [Chromatiales bacterium]
MTQAAQQRFGKVAVMMGGWSAEREVSLKSGEAVLSGLQARGIDAQGVDVGRNICQVLTESKFERVFNILHGTGGEDGAIQGLMEILNIPFTGSGVAASALTMDKLLTKRIWRSAGLPTPAFMRLTAETDWPAVVSALGLPLIVKPVSEGSSIGMYKIEQEAELKPAWEKASEYGAVFAEQWVAGEEYTVAILKGESLPIIRLETPHQFYDYDAKYAADDTQYFCPCGLSPEQEDSMQKLALMAFNTLGASGWGRVDIMRDAEGKDWLIEVNTVPGMTSHSLVPKAAKAAGIEFDELVERILETSFK